VAILQGDLVGYYQNRKFLKQSETTLERLVALNEDYDALLAELEAEPNVVRRIARASFGQNRSDANLVYPSVTAEQLETARRVLAGQSDEKDGESELPDWVSRCGKPAYRIMLFIAGAALILISFVWFGPARKAPQ